MTLFNYLHIKTISQKVHNLKFLKIRKLIKHLTPQVYLINC